MNTTERGKMGDDKNIVLHPVQKPASNKQSLINSSVTLRAYEVYSHIFSPQEAIINGGCRGGFGCGELMALLYARSFPKEEWRMRYNEACKGMASL